MGSTVTFICFPGFELNGNKTLECVASGAVNGTSGKWSGEVPTCRLADNTFFTTVWFRILIDIAAVVVALFIIIIVFLVVRYIRRRRQGIFHRWTPPSSRSSSRAPAALRSEGYRVQFRNHSNPSLSTLVEDSQGFSSSRVVADNDDEVANATPDQTHGTLGSTVPLPAPVPGASLGIKGCNFVDSVTFDQQELTYKTAGVVSDKQEPDTFTVQGGSAIASSALSHDSNISTAPKDRPGSAANFNIKQSFFPKTVDRLDEIAVNTKRTRSAVFDANPKTGELTAAKPAVRPKSSIVHRPLAESSRSAAYISREEPSFVKAPFQRKKTTKEIVVLKSAELQNTEPSSAVKSFTTTADHAPAMKELASAINHSRLSLFGARASKKPKIAERRRHSTQGARSRVVSEPFIGIPDMDGQSEVMSKPDDAGDGYCALLVGLQNEYCALRLGSPDNPHDGEKNKPALVEDEANAKTKADHGDGDDLEMDYDYDDDDDDDDDDDYVQLRVGEDLGDSGKGTSGNPEGGVGSPVEELGMAQTPENDPYEMVAIGPI
eukprot:XP_011675049.1 PREDICTED: uncharacterized protein LOC105443507 [Strongylocentrotus purpuratus]